MIKRVCKIGLLILIGFAWHAPAFSQEAQKNAEATDLRRVEIQQLDAQDSDVITKVAADTSQISPGTKKSFTERISSSGCGVPGGVYDVDADTPNFINFIDKGVSFDILNNEFILKFEIEVEASAPGGDHDVKLTYRFGTSGGILLCTKKLDLVINTDPVAAPTADFSGSPRSGTKPLTVQFTDASSGAINSRSWNFGDGQSSTATNPSHVYNSAGTYTVSLRVTGPGGSNTRTRSNYITVTEPVAPVADFTGSPTSGFKPLTVQFTDVSSGQVTSHFWNFGDGQNSTAVNPSHTYLNAGAYTVTMLVTGPGGSNSKTRENYINVMELSPVADFTGSPTSGTKPLTVQFTDVSSGQITSRLWNFGDGQTSAATHPSHTYVDAGVYTVSVTITGPGGSNTKTLSNYITVQEPVLAAPRNLTAQTGVAESVPLDWESPQVATADTVELLYDDGTSESLLRGNFSGAELAVRFTPTSYPATLITMGFLAQGDISNDAYGVKVYLDPAASNAGPAGTPVVTGQVSFPSDGFILADFPNPITIESGDFYIALNYISGTTQDFAIGQDKSSDALRSWLKSGSTFMLARDITPEFAGNLVIRALVVTSSSSSMIAVAGSPAIDRRKVHQIVPLQSESRDEQSASAAYSISKNDFSRSVGILSSNYGRPQTLTSALLNYNIYRSTSSPVAVVAQNRIGNSAANATNFNDTNVTAGVTYHYVVTAVYDGGESGPSNEASATPISGNNPPVAANPISNKTLTVGATFTQDLNASPRVFTDVDGDALSYNAGSSNSSIAGAAISGSVLTVSPVAAGSATITITANDGQGGTASTTFTVQVDPANTFCSADAPKSISDLDTTTSTLTINNDLIIGDVNVHMFISHSYVTDVEAFLTSPAGIKVELFSDIGGSANNFGSACSPQANCVIDDQAATNIAGGSAPFVGSFQSEELTLGALNGENAKGTWTLTIVDNGSGDTGTLNCWCLEMQPAAPNDVGVAAIDLPKLVLLGSSAAVNVVVKNFGSSPQSNFPVSYQIDGGPAVIENFSGTLEIGTHAAKTFAGQWTPSAEGMYRFMAWTMLNGDASSNNDSLPTLKEVVVRESNATPTLAGINNYTVRAGAIRSIPLFAFDADGDSMAFNIPNNPGFLSLSRFSQHGDTASATLVISAPRDLTDSFNASVEVRDRFDAAVLIAFTVQVVPRVLNAPANLTASLSQNAVQLNWQAPAIASNSPYAGIWSGTNSQNLPVYMRITDDGFIDSLNVRFRTSWINATCTLNFPQNNLVEIKNGEFDVFLSVAVTSVSTTMHGAFSSESAVSGNYDESSGGGFIYCGSQFIIQIGGTQLSAGTWQANKTAPGGGSLPPVLQGYDIYRSSQPDARLTGTKIGSVDANTTAFIDANIFDGMHFYQITAIYDLGESDPSNDASRLITGVKDRATELPAVYALEQNYPNPFNPETENRFQLPKGGDVVLKIFNVLGAEVRTLVDAPYHAGYHTVRWDGKNNRGNQASSGLYFYRIVAGDFSQVRKMSLFRRIRLRICDFGF